MVNASAFSVRTGDKVIVTQFIPPRVLNDRSSVEPPRNRQGWEVIARHGIPRGTIGRVVEIGTGTVAIGYELKNVQITSFKDAAFEKYFAVRV